MKKQISLGLMLICLISCDNEVDKPKCGCRSEEISNISDNQPLIGQLIVNDETSFFDQYEYVLIYQESNCTNCIHFIYACNESEIVNQLIVGDSPVDIEFSGNLKMVCSRPFGPADYTYNLISNLIIQEL